MRGGRYRCPETGFPAPGLTTMADGDELRCEAAPSTRAAGEPVDERARGGRCTRRAEVYLFNGSRSQGKACGECGRRLAKEFKFIELRPIT